MMLSVMVMVIVVAVIIIIICRIIIVIISVSSLLLNNFFFKINVINRSVTLNLHDSVICSNFEESIAINILKRLYLIGLDGKFI